MNIMFIVLPCLTAGIRQNRDLEVPHGTSADEWTARRDKESQQTDEAGINRQQSPRGQSPPAAS